MDDCASLVETVLQWMSSSQTARQIDRDIGDLQNDLMGDAPLLSYLRYNVTLSKDEVEALRPGMSDRQITSLGEMDNPGALDALLELGNAAGEQKV